MGRRDDLLFMRMALAEADAAAAEMEVPVGAVVVSKGGVVGRGRNRTIGACDPTAHAEILAIGAAAHALRNYRLAGCAVYATVEPCAMCMGAMVWARIARLVFGAPDAKAGCAGSVLDLARVRAFNHRIAVAGGILADECAGRMQEFFRRLRRKEGVH